MQTNIFNLLIPLPGEPGYKANWALAATRGGVAYMDVGEVREQGAASFATPWNRLAVPRRGALPCATASALFASFN